MAFGPDAFDFRLKGAVEAVFIDFFVFYEGVCGYEPAEALRVYEVVFNSVLFRAPGGAGCRADGELEFGVQPEKMADYGAFAGAGRG